MEDINFSKRYVIPCMVQMLQVMFLWSMLAYITIFWIDQGFTHLQVGLLVAVFPLTSLTLMIPFGIFVDRISPRKLVIASQLIFSVCIFGLLMTHEFWPTLLLLAIGGSGNALFNNALPSLYLKTLGADFRGIKLGFFNASWLFGYGLGPLISGFIMQSWGMNAVFTFALAGQVPLMLLSMFLADVPGTAVRLADYKADLSNKSVLIFIVLVFFFSLHAGAEQTSMSLFLNKDIGLSKEEVGWMYFIHANIMALLSLASGLVGDRFNARGRGLAALFYTGIIISGLTNIMLLLANSFGSFLALRIPHAVGDSIAIVTRSLIVSNFFATTRMGGNLGAVTTTVWLGTLIGCIISGIVPGYAMGFVIAGALAILAIPITMIARPRF
ncbi:MAG: MFS transporter [Dehalococcoidia bacterium]|nr:MFS transporter [Dehalococcoidia bacterium]